MNSDGYSRSVSLQCPTCGATQFEYDEVLGSDLEKVRCVSCDREMTKEELIYENSENLDEHMRETGEQALKDMANEMRKSLKKVFGGSKT